MQFEGIYVNLVFLKRNFILQIHTARYSQTGFTLIELIIVIIILGILAVTVAPRFINVSDDANRAATASQAAAFRAGIKLVYSAYQIRQLSPIIIGDKSVQIDSVSNWPTGSGSGIQFCVNLWNSVVDSSESITGKSDPNSSLSSGWNAFGNADLCAYSKKTGDLTLAGGSLPHFIYYIRDYGPVSFGGQTYEGSAGDIKAFNI
jgi:prepilin-type N-terminal cleavage/methylation domain-containing protein